jgi:pro-apoptotic serine protease NMA111
MLERLIRPLAVVAAGLLAGVCAAAPPEAAPAAAANPPPPPPISERPATAAAAGAGVGEERPEWARTLERIAPSVVAIQVDLTRAFDTEWNASAQATGFVVDARRGLILTNRHVVTAGPVTAQAVFLDREEVELKPVYRDPVHDFGIYRYDPSKLHFITPKDIPLAPEGAQVGTEIRVVGNDAGEQLSILGGTLARLDRQAPNYGLAKYNDFNTFYYQAASSTSGGSSGSPVLDIRGRAIALNAGGATGAASSFYLPLDRVVRALRLIQAGQPVPRGTLMTVFEYTPFDTLRRLGLPAGIETAVRRAQPNQIGMLVATAVQPGSSTAGLLEVGDIVVHVNGRLVTEFTALADALDDAVGRTVALEIVRGGKTLERTVQVVDLESVTPKAFVSVGEAVVHDLSYQMARHFNVPVHGVYVANPGYLLGAAGVPRGAVLTSFNGRATGGLDDFWAAAQGLADQERATARYFTLDDTRSEQVRVVRMDRRWFPAQRCERDDKLGYWPCQDMPPPPAPTPPTPASTTFAVTGDARADRLAPSLVYVLCDLPYSVSGVTEHNYHGTGLVVDAERGLIVVDRNTVPVAMSDARVIFAGTVEVPAKVVFVHPLHNLAVLAYDPRLIGTTPVKSARFARREPIAGESVWVVGMRPDQRVVTEESRVSGLDAVQFPPSPTYAFRDSNLEAMALVNGPTDLDGVVTDKAGDVLALWSSFAYDKGRELQQVNMGIPSDLVTELVSHVQRGENLRSLEAEFAVIPLSGARELGLDSASLKRLESHSAARRQALVVTRLVAGSPAAHVLKAGDLLLTVDGEVVNRFREVERAVQKPHVRLTVARNGAEVPIEVDTVALSGEGIDRVVLWAGATLQAPHRAMAVQRGIPPEGVFVANLEYGSPATRYGLWAGRRIVEANGTATPDLDAFLKAVEGRPDRASVRLRTISWNGAVEVITLKLDRHYWPAYQLSRGPDGWQRHALD